MSWGWKITLAYSAFVLAIVGLVYASSQRKVDLVVKDYYQQELQYSKRMNAIRAANQLSSMVSITTRGAMLEITFPNECIAESAIGTIRLYRPSGSGADQSWPISIDGSGVQQLPIADPLPGYYIVKVDWTMQGKEFYTEQSIYLTP